MARSKSHRSNSTAPRTPRRAVSTTAAQDRFSLKPWQLRLLEEHQGPLPSSSDETGIIALAEKCMVFDQDRRSLVKVWIVKKERDEAINRRRTSSWIDEQMPPPGPSFMPPSTPTAPSSASAFQESPQRESTPPRELTPVQELTPARESTPVQELTPARESIPTQELTPVRGLTPVPSQRELAPDPPPKELSHALLGPDSRGLTPLNLPANSPGSSDRSNELRQQFVNALLATTNVVFEAPGSTWEGLAVAFLASFNEKQRKLEERRERDRQRRRERAKRPLMRELRALNLS